MVEYLSFCCCRLVFSIDFYLSSKLGEEKMRMCGYARQRRSVYRGKERKRKQKRGKDDYNISSVRTHCPASDIVIVLFHFFVIHIKVESSFHSLLCSILFSFIDTHLFVFLRFLSKRRRKEILYTPFCCRLFGSNQVSGTSSQHIHTTFLE